MSTGLVVLGAVGLGAFAVLAILRPRFSLVTLVVLDVSNINGVVVEHLGTSPYRPQLALAVLVIVVMAFRRQLRWRWSPVHLGLMVLLAAFCLSFVHAADPVVSMSLLAERSRDLFYFVVVFALTLSTNTPRLVVRSSVIILAGLAALTVAHEFLLHNQGDLLGLSRVPLVQEGGASTARHAGTSSDVNFWARLLILFAPLSMSLLAASRGRWSRMIWGGCTLSLFLGVYLTQSRGGFIALFIAMVCWLAFAGGWYRKIIIALPVALLVIVPVSGIGNRLMTLVSPAAGAGGGDDLSVLTRKRLQLDAWHMFLDRPLFGHGIGSYGTLFREYDRTANTYLPVDIVVAAHNFYLEQAADGGLVLVLAWMIFAGTVAFAALRARRLTLDDPDQARLGLLSVGILGGVLGWSVASVFLHLSDFRSLLLVAAVAAVVDLEARRVAVHVPAPARARRRGSAIASALGITAVLGAAGVTTALLLAPPVFTNTSTLAVQAASSSVDGSNAYQVDVLSRGNIVPTLTQVLAETVTSSDVSVDSSDDIDVSVSESPLGGSIVVSVQAPTADLADRAGNKAVAVSIDRIAGLNSSYIVTGEMSGAEESTEPSPLVALPIIPAALVGTVVWLWRRNRPRSRANLEPEVSRSKT